MSLSLSHRTAVTAVTLLTLGAGALRAQITTDTTVAVRAGVRLSLQSMNGSVTVRSWNRNQIRVLAESDRARVDVQSSGNVVSVRTESRRTHSEVEYSISVPAGTPIEVANALSVDVQIAGVCGPVNITTVSGDIDVQCIEGDGIIGSVSGDISISDARGPLEVNATSGDVSVTGSRGPTRLHNVSGDVSVSDVSHPELDVETVNGDVEYSGPILNNGRYRFAAHSGDVGINVQGNLNALFSVSTFSGDFESEYEITINPGTTMHGKDMEFRIPSSGSTSNSARVRLNSFSGTISLRRAGGGRNREE